MKRRIGITLLAFASFGSRFVRAGRGPRAKRRASGPQPRHGDRSFVGQFRHSGDRPRLSHQEVRRTVFRGAQRAHQREIVEAAKVRQDAEARSAEVDRRLANLQADLAALRAESRQELESLERHANSKASAEIAQDSKQRGAGDRGCREGGAAGIEALFGRTGGAYGGRKDSSAHDARQCRTRWCATSSTEPRRPRAPRAGQLKNTMTLSAVATRYANALADVVTAQRFIAAPGGRAGRVAGVRIRDSGIAGIGVGARNARHIPPAARRRWSGGSARYIEDLARYAQLSVRAGRSPPHGFVRARLFTRSRRRSTSARGFYPRRLHRRRR